MTCIHSLKCSNLDQWILETESESNNCSLTQNASLSREWLETLQLSRLNQLLQKLRAKQLSPYLLPERLHSLDELKTLPFTTPQMLSEHPGRYLQISQSAVSRVISGATSGTTGPAKRVFYTAQDTRHTIGFFAAGISEMAAPGEKVLIDFPFSGSFGLGDLISQAVSKIGSIPVPGFPDGTYAKRCQHILTHQPDCYIGFPVPLLSLIRFWQTDPAFCSVPFPIRRALISGDSCPKGVIKELETLLGSRLFPHYGSREMGLGGAITCPAHEGMHLRENHIIAEIIGPDMQPVPDGEWGELVITTIGLEAMPLLRYRTGDYTRFLPDPCSCGSITRRLDSISRSQTGQKDSGFSIFSIEELDSLLFSVPELIDYRIHMNIGTDIFSVNLDILSASGKARQQLADVLDVFFTRCPKYNRQSFSQSTDNIILNEKKCLPEDTSLYSGKRYIITL